MKHLWNTQIKICSEIRLNSYLVYMLTHSRWGSIKRRNKAQYCQIKFHRYQYNLMEWVSRMKNDNWKLSIFKRNRNTEKNRRGNEVVEYIWTGLSSKVTEKVKWDKMKEQRREGLMSYCHRPRSYHLVRQRKLSLSHLQSLWHSPAKLAQDLGAWGMPTFLISLGISIFEKESIIRHLLSGDVSSDQEETKEMMVSDSFGSKEGNISIKVDKELGKVTL